MLYMKIYMIIIIVNIYNYLIISTVILNIFLCLLFAIECSSKKDFCWNLWKHGFIFIYSTEIVSYADTAQYLRKLVHDVGQELKSSAIALQVRRTGDGPFTVEHGLLKKHWKLDRIAQAIEQCRPLVDPSELVPLSRGREAVRIMQEVDQR